MLALLAIKLLYEHFIFTLILKTLIFPTFFSFQGVEELTPGIKMLLNLLFKICPYVQCGLIITLIVAGISLVGSALLSCFWLSSTAAANSTTNPLSKSQQQQRQSAQKSRLLLIEPVATAEVDIRNKNHKKTNVCIVPLLAATTPTKKPTIREMDCEGTQPQMVVDYQQKNKSKLKRWQNKFNKKDNTLLPFFHDDLMASSWK